MLELPIKLYQHENKLIEICNSFIGKSIELTASFNNMIIPIDNCNCVGDIMETLFFNEISKILLDFEEGPKQESPDFYACNKLFEYEMKVFLNKPGFDIANFESFIQQLCNENGLFRKLFKTKYLIFKYSINENKITIEQFYYLNIWNIISYSTKNPISVQIKRNMWYNIRPSSPNTWYDNSKTPHVFIEKIIESINKCNQVHDKHNKINNILMQYNILINKYTF